VPLVDLKRKVILNEEDFFERLFPKRYSLSLEAVKIFRMIMKGEITECSYLDVPEKLGISRNQFYYILRKLRHLGMIRKVNGRYEVSRDFVRRLDMLKEYYENLITRE
jgi:predicted transcriptional regulator